MTLGNKIHSSRIADLFDYGNDKIVKLFSEKTLKEFVEYEFNINKVAGQYDCPVPKVIEIIEHEGRFGLVFEKIIGQSVTEILKKPMKNAKQVAMHTASAHAKIHSVAFGSSGHPFDQHSIVLPRQYDYFKSKILKTEALSDEEKTDIIDYLMKLPDKLRLCHGDLHTGNYLVSDSKHYVIDWREAYIGHPASDIARVQLLVQTPSSSNELSGVKKAFKSMFIQSYLRSFIRMYMQLTGLKQHELDAWILPVAAARLSEEIPDEREWLLALIKDELNKQRYH